jgi:hypothetical protein
MRVLPEFPDFFGWLEHHPVVMVIAVLAAGVTASMIMALIIGFSRPVY